jgi:uncharacterized protein (TIGR02466 family)|tara:strand:- start:394 stop:999 length:606 start_codon:yes stop_codon:yes gene_type:complete
MKTHNLYPVQVYEFNYPGDVQHFCEVIEADPTLTQRHESGVFTTYFDAHKTGAYGEIAHFVRSCLDKIQEDNNFSCSGFEITSMWANYFPDGVAMTCHRHANSYWSGVLYLSDGAPTVFFDPIQQRAAGQFELYRLPKFQDGISANQEHIETIPAEAGKMIVFPSWFMHETGVSKGDRYSISFNSLPQGVINGGIANIDVK